MKDVYDFGKEAGEKYIDSLKKMGGYTVDIVKKVPEVIVDFAKKLSEVDKAARTGAKIVVNEVKIGYEKAKEYVKNVFK